MCMIKKIKSKWDVVLIKECRPISKTKAWELVDIVESAVVYSLCNTFSVHL